MSRIGKKGVLVPEKTEVLISVGSVRVKGPLGELTRPFKPDIKVSLEGNKVNFAMAKNTLANRALWGTYASHVSNMIQGVNKAYEKKLIVEGIGFKAEVKGGNLALNLGFSHQIIVAIPKEIKVTSEKNVITVSGLDKEAVGQFTAKIRALKKPEPYKGKGIRYEGEVIRRKEGKKAA